MLRRIRELMATPFARPPGRRKFLSRFDPEVRAAIIYAVVLLIAWAFRSDSGSLAGAVAVGYLLAGLMLLVSPAAQVAGALSGEVDRGTAEALVLTPGDHSRLAWGRFLHAAWPWLRMVLWLLPMHLVMGYAFMGLRLGSDDAFVGVLASLGPKPASVAVTMDGWRSGDLLEPEIGLAMALGRFLKDALDVLTLAAVGYWISALAGSGRRAVWMAGLAGPGLILTVFLADMWLVVGVQIVARLAEIGGVDTQEVAGTVYVLAALAMLAFQVLAIWWCVGRVARNFDRYLARETAGP